ncbi:MAG: DUF1385 domain-containing protein [Thermodesulfovibrio sp.]|nr:DUF1385 domain-containing protein [Thermodesulfovibrio sp.]
MKNIGGQAVIEGVLFRSQQGWAVAVRSPEGDIVLKSEKIKKGSKLTKIPLIRGFFILIDAVCLGIRAINFSSQVAFREKKTNPLSFILSLFFAILFGIALFILLPLYATKFIGSVFDLILLNTFVFNFFDGLIRVLIFIVYVYLVSLYPYMKRVFQYHGAEHKVINAFEAGEILNKDFVKRYSRFHIRCGTSFIFIVLVVSILVFSLIPSSWSFPLKALSRIILLPTIAGISYELLRLMSKWRDSLLVKVFALPGLLFQKITTREPDDTQIEVALESLKEVLKLSGGKI